MSDKLLLLKNYKNMLIFTFTVIAGFWCIDAVVDYIFHYDEPFLEVLFPSGKEFWFRALYSILILIFGSYISYIVRANAVSQEALQKSQNLFRELVEFTDVVHWEMEMPGRKFTYVSPQILALLGCPPSQWVDFESRMESVHPEDSERVRGLMEEMINASEGGELVYRMSKNGGESAWIKETIGVCVKDGRVVRLRGMMMDVTTTMNAERMLRSALQEKEILLREVHHRVKNNMSIIVSLLDLQHRRTDDEHVANVFSKARNRIMAMAYIHEMLYASQDLGAVNVQDYLNRLVQDLARVYSSDMRDIIVRVVTDDIRLMPDKLIPCGLIVNELVTNSLNYAFPEGRGGNVHVSLNKDGDTLRLVVKDDGRGFLEGMDFKKGSGSSLGLMLVDALVKQLDGNVEFGQDQGGAKVVVSFS